MSRKTRSDEIINWIQHYCVYPNGPERGRPLHLTQARREQLRSIYHNPNGLRAAAVITGPLAAYVALYHVCGPLAPQREPAPLLEADTFTTWSATGPQLKAVLKHEGARIVCPELGTKYPAAA